jgi:predicted TIM-barrel fold metal-dependent hydrolase
LQKSSADDITADVNRRVIDVHHHMFPAALTTALRDAGVAQLGGERVPQSWSPEDSLRVMDRYDIDVAMLSVPAQLPIRAAERRRGVARAVNTFGGTCRRRWPDRFGFFASLPLPDVASSLAELNRALDDGAEGAAVLTNHDGVYPGDATFDELYAELDRRRLVAFVHPTVPPTGTVAGSHCSTAAAQLQPSLLEFPFDTTRALASLVLARTVERFPGVRFVFTHCGGCLTAVADRLVDRKPIVARFEADSRRGSRPSIDELETMLHDAQRATLAQLRKVHFDVALAGDARVIAGLCTVVPPGRLVLGTDYPMGQEIGVDVTFSTLRRCTTLSDAERSGVLSGNAVGLFPDRRQS